MSCDIETVVNLALYYPKTQPHSQAYLQDKNLGVGKAGYEASRNLSSTFGLEPGDLGSLVPGEISHIWPGNKNRSDSTGNLFL